MGFGRIALFTLLLWSTRGPAQPADGAAGGAPSSHTNLVGVHAGRLLPFGVYGVRDIYPYFGLRFGHQIGGQDFEWSTAFVHAKGVRFYSGSVSLTFPSELEGFKFLPFLGLDMHYYSGRTRTRTLPFSTSGGFHLGVSPLIEITSSVALRADFKFNFNPGRTLHVGGCLQVSF